MENIGKRIFALRKKHGITQKELSARTGISQSSISDIENRTKNPSSMTLQLICEALGCSISDLFEEKEIQPAVSDGELDEKLVNLLLDLSPDEVQRVEDFVAGLKASRTK